MWPFGRKGTSHSLVGLEEVTEVELCVTLVSDNTIQSAVTGSRAAILFAEVCERAGPNDPPHTRLARGMHVFGDVVTFRDDNGGMLVFVAARRVHFRLGDAERRSIVLETIPDVLAPLMRSIRDQTEVTYREYIIRQGDRVRLQAIVEPTRDAVTTAGYRSAPQLTFRARDDLAPVFLAPVP